MEVLVSAATKHGATGEIADAVAGRLADRGLEVTVEAPENVSGIDHYDAFVVGSAIYAGHWLKPAVDLATRVATETRGRPTWLFSSGPLGDPPKPEGDPAQATELVAAVRPRDHRVFPGRLDRSRLSRMERAVVKMVRAPEGDDRDFDEIRRWADRIADALLGSPVAGEPGAGVGES